MTAGTCDAKYRAFWSWDSDRRRLAIPIALRHTIHMKRMNLVLDEQTLEDAARLSGERSYSRTVNRALSEFVKHMKAHRILELAGSGAWAGDLSEMRDEHSHPTGRQRRGPR
jgi:hypothetical protein